MTENAIETTVETKTPDTCNSSHRKPGTMRITNITIIIANLLATTIDNSNGINVIETINCTQ
jgi:hypothetical protein